MLPICCLLVFSRGQLLEIILDYSTVCAGLTRPSHFASTSPHPAGETLDDSLWCTISTLGAHLPNAMEEEREECEKRW